MPPATTPSRAVYIRRRLVAGLVGAGLVGGVVVGAQALGANDDAARGDGPATIVTDAATTPVSPPLTDAVTSTTPRATADVTSAGTSIVSVTTRPSTPTTVAATTVTTSSPSSTSSGPATSATSTTAVREAIALDTTAPVIDAAAYGVYDASAGEWLTATDADEARPVGSIMKLLTAHVVMKAGDPAKAVTVPTLRLDPAESAIGLYAGEQLPRDVLLRAMMIVSANDAAEALAIDVGGTRERFIEMMNEAADDLGLDGTVASNPSGLDGGGAVSTVRDMVTLAAELMEDATFRTTVARTSASLHGQTFPATNDLLGQYVGADGIKTGSTTQAGYGVVASATRAGRTIIVAVFGSASDDARFMQAAALLDWGFAQPA
jgi:D-alanyl-D-alanine carboxypeptidase